VHIQQVSTKYVSNYHRQQCYVCNSRVHVVTNNLVHVHRFFSATHASSAAGRHALSIPSLLVNPVASQIAAIRSAMAFAVSTKSLRYRSGVYTCMRIYTYIGAG
jgi:hypothetical protein